MENRVDRHTLLLTPVAGLLGLREWIDPGVRAAVELGHSARIRLMD